MSQINGSRVLVAISTVLALVCGLLIATVPRSAEALYAGSWSITMVSQREYIGAGAERVFDDSNAELIVGGGGPWVIRLNADGGWYGDSFDFEFRASYGRAISPGWYPRAQRASSQASSRPGMAIDGDGRGCNTIAGNFEVRDIAWSSTGTLERLWLIYEQHCDEGRKALFGEIRLGVPVGAADVEPDAVRWPEGLTVASTEPVPIVVRQTSAAAVHVSGATLVGAHPQDFSILSDQCSGQTLNDGEGCVVFVRFTPTSPGARSAALRLTTDAATSSLGSTDTECQASPTGSWSASLATTSEKGRPTSTP